MQRNDHLDRRESNHPAPASPQPSFDVLWNAVLLFGLSLVFASLAPSELFAASLSSLLVFATVSCALAALVRSEAVLDDRPTHWDVGAVFMAMSIVLSWFVDPQAIEAVLATEPK